MKFVAMLLLAFIASVMSSWSPAMESMLLRFQTLLVSNVFLSGIYLSSEHIVFFEVLKEIQHS